MGGRTWKFSGTQASRGLKQVAGIAKRGFKHIGNAESLFVPVPFLGDF